MAPRIFKYTVNTATANISAINFATDRLPVSNLATMNGNQLYYNSALLTAGQKITNYDPALLVLKSTSATATTSTFEFAFEDAAGERSAIPALYGITFANRVSENAALPVTLLSFTVKNKTKT